MLIANYHLHFWKQMYQIVSSVKFSILYAFCHIHFKISLIPALTVCCALPAVFYPPGVYRYMSQVAPLPSQASHLTVVCERCVWHHQPDLSQESE